MSTVNEYYKQIVDRLSLKQYDAVIRKAGSMNMVIRAEYARKVTRDRKTLQLIDALCARHAQDIEDAQRPSNIILFRQIA